MNLLLEMSRLISLWGTKKHQQIQMEAMKKTCYYLVFIVTMISVFQVLRPIFTAIRLNDVKGKSGNLTFCPIDGDETSKDQRYITANFLEPGGLGNQVSLELANPHL